MIAAALVASALAKPPKPRPAPAVVAPAGPPAPVAPAPAALRWPADALPGLAGATEVITGQNLSRDTATMAFEYDFSAFDRLDAAGVDALFALLAADPGWRVGVGPEGRVATRVDGGAGLSGWHVGDGRCNRLAIVDARGPAFTGPRVASAPATGGAVTVKAFRPNDGPPACRTWATAVVIDAALLDIEIYESGAVDQRPWTLDALQELPRLATWARLDGERLRAEGHREPPPPPGPARCEAGPLPGTLRVERWVNPAAPGRVWLRLLDAAGAPWAVDQVGPATLQVAGWSADPAHTFPVGAVFPVPPGAGFAGTAEWWFQAADGAVSRLSAEPVTVPAR